MALPTSTTGAPATPQQPTPGIGQQSTQSAHDAEEARRRGETPEARRQREAEARRRGEPLGIGRMGEAPALAPTEAAEPVLFDDIDPVLLVRLYPDAVNSGAARTLAMAAGETAREQGATLVASQQEPVMEFGEDGLPVRRDDAARRRDPARHADPARPHTDPPTPPHTPPAPPHTPPTQSPPR